MNQINQANQVSQSNLVNAETSLIPESQTASPDSMDRRIFSYFDGESTVFEDPSELDYQIEQHQIQQMMNPSRVELMPKKEDGSVDFDKLDDMDMKLLVDMAHEAEPLIRKAFKIKPFDRTTGKGLLYEDVTGLYGRYLDWREGVKKNTDLPPDSPHSTG
jgi:hypothetical protein